MGRIVVNKHFDNINDIKIDKFHENGKSEFAKGEIIIYNGEKPSIFVIDSKGKPQRISGNESVSEDVINSIKEELSEAISTLETTILEYTINDIPLSEKPVLKGDNIKIEGYNSINIKDEQNENVVDNDAIQTAIKKVETMVFINTQTMTASLNDINRKATQKLFYPPLVDGFYELADNSLNVFEDKLTKINFNFEGCTEDIINNCEVLFTIGNVIEEINLPIQYSNMSLNELKPNTRYLFKIRYDFVEIIELMSK